MCLAGDVCGHHVVLHTGIAYVTCPAATIDVTYRTTFDISRRAGGEVFSSKQVIDSTGSTCSIEVLVNNATKKCDISGAIDITATYKGIVFITKSTAVCIVTYISPFVDNDVGIVAISLVCPVVHLCYPYQLVVQIGRNIISITFFQRLKRNSVVYLWVIALT